MSTEAVQPIMRMHWGRLGLFGGIHVLALAAFFFPFEWRFVPVMAVIYAWSVFSSTFYLHRYLSHKSYEMAGWLKFVFFVGSQLGFYGTPAFWVGLHRWHHAKSDQAEDLTSPVNGKWHSYFGWIITTSDEEPAARAKLLGLSKDIQERYGYIALLEKYQALSLVPYTVLAGALYAWAGPAAVLYGLSLPVVLGLNGLFCVNTFCHLPRAGYQRYATRDQSVNVWWVGLMHFGEGWHNNHHADPGCALGGRTWYEVDATNGLIWVLEKLRLVWNVRWTPAKQLQEAEAA